MLYFHWQKLAFLEVPKTGSSAVRKVLAPLATIDINGPPRARHQNGPIFERITRSWLEQITTHKVETFAVMRDPVDRIRSWYRFLGRQEKYRQQIDNMRFEDFVDSVLAGEDLTRAVGRQDIFFMGDGDSPLIQHIFRYDQPEHLHAFLGDRFDRPFAFPPRQCLAQCQRRRSYPFDPSETAASQAPGNGPVGGVVQERMAG